MQCTLYTASNSGCSKLTYIPPWDNSGNLSFSITAPRPTVYGVGVRSMTERPGRQTIYGTPDVEYNVYVDGDLYTTKWTISHSGVGIPIDPFFGKVYLTSGHTPTERVSYNNTASASAKKGDENLCTAIIGNLEKDFLTTTITKGSEYLSFYDAVTGSLIGDSYMEDINGIYANLKYDTPYYGTEDYQAEITTEVNGYTKSATFKLILEECGTGAPVCEEETKIPSITLNDSYQEGDFGIHRCGLSDTITYPAYFYPLISDKNKQYTYENYEVEVCFDQSQQNWKSRISGNSINIRAIRTFCNDVLYSPANTIIENIEDIGIKISPENACEAMKYFFYHMSYPSGSKFAIKEFIEEHEKAHADSFRTYIKIAENGDYNYNSTHFDNYSDLIKSFDGDCTKYLSLNHVQQEAVKIFSNANDILRKNLIKIFREQYSKEDEQIINLNLISIILKYQDKIIEIYPEIKNNFECYAYYLGE